MKPIINIVWFKKDLRWQDHEPLARAAASDEPFLLLYIFEPSVQAAPDWALRHWKFIYASLQEMNENLKKHEQMFTIFYGECEDVFHFLSLQFEIKNIFSHQEIGNDVTFKRDKFLKKYFPSQNIVWQESRCNGIIRGLRQRDSWEQSWQKFMSQKIVPLKFNPTKIQSFQHSYLSLPEDMRSRLSCYPSDFQPAGVQAAKQLLITFLEERGKN